MSVPIEVLEWQGANGQIVTLHGIDGVWLLPGPSGLGMPPVELDTFRSPTRQGAIVQRVRHGVRIIGLPLAVLADDAQGARDRMRYLFGAVDPVTHGAAGKLRSRLLDNTRREITAIYTGGMGGDEGRTGPARTEYLGMLELACPDPYWRDEADTIVDVAMDEAGPAWFPFPPLVLGSGAIEATFTVVNDGQIDAWPVWTITGPGSSPLLENVTTGEWLALSGDLDATGELIIDTNEGVKTITNGFGGNEFGRWTVGSTLWRLPPGASTVRLTMTDAIVNVSKLELRYRRGYLSA